MTTEEQVDRIEGKLDKILDDISAGRVTMARNNIYLANHAKRLTAVEISTKNYEADRNKVIGGAFVGGGVFGAIGGFLVYLFEHHR